MSDSGSVWADLRRLADWFSTSPQRQSIHIDRVVARLGTTCIALLGRELRHADPRRREASRAQLAQLADDVLCRARVVAELRSITEDLTTSDDAKVCALGLLSELGERAAARFTDPSAIQQRSALALASQLASDADVASAADLMVRQLAHSDILSMLEVMVDAANGAARRLIAELGMRLDLPVETRDAVARLLVDASDPAVAADAGATPVVPVIPVVASGSAGAARARRSTRTTQVAVLVDAAARIVVVVSKKLLGERRYRRWAVLLGQDGTIVDCLHEDGGDNEQDAAPLIATLVADGYRVASSDLDHARTIVAAAARLTAITPTRTGENLLPSAYYLGRDMLDLGDAHLGERPSREKARLATLARALEYIGDGEHARGAQLLAECTPPDHDSTADADAEYFAALAHTQLVANDLSAAVASLERALAIEPDWPLHHYNLAVALHRMHDTSGCFHALRKFITTSADAPALAADPAQADRLALAERTLLELERAARVSGVSLRRRRSKKRVPALTT